MSSGSHRRIINREVREIPAESSIWFNLGLVALGIAAGAATAAIGLVKNPTAEATLWTIAASAAVFAVGSFLAHIDVNRGRRVKRSVVLEEDAELDA